MRDFAAISNSDSQNAIDSLLQVAHNYNRLLYHYCGDKIKAVRWGKYKMHFNTAIWESGSEGEQPRSPPLQPQQYCVISISVVKVAPPMWARYAPATARDSFYLSFFPSPL